MEPLVLHAGVGTSGCFQAFIRLGMYLSSNAASFLLKGAGVSGASVWVVSLHTESKASPLTAHPNPGPGP